jgi:hypothetical protein
VQILCEDITQLYAKVLHDARQAAGAASVHAEYADTCHLIKP